jgi:MFS family permease
MDQQLFILTRVPAMNELLTPAAGELPARGDIDHYGGISTAKVLIGWAIGAPFLGMLGDRIGRAKTMMWTILADSVCTGLRAFSTNVCDLLPFHDRPWCRS